MSSSRLSDCVSCTATRLILSLGVATYAAHEFLQLPASHSGRKSLAFVGAAAVYLGSHTIYTAIVEQF